MNDAFRHLNMPRELACEFLAVLSRLEYALKATPAYANGDGTEVRANWDRFANDINESFCAIQDKVFQDAVDFLLSKPPRKQVLKDGVLDFDDQVLDVNQTKAWRTLLLTLTIRNNLFHGGKYSPNGEKDRGRDEQLVRSSLTILLRCAMLNDEVRQRYEH